MIVVKKMLMFIDVISAIKDLMMVMKYIVNIIHKLIVCIIIKIVSKLKEIEQWIKMDEKTYKENILIGKIKMQIENHKKDMAKNDAQFDFYEGRKIEAGVILSWVKEHFAYKKG